MEAHQAPLSLGFSRQEHWSGLPFPSPMHESEKWKWSHSVVSNPQRPHGLQPSRLLCPWDFPGKSTGVGCHCLLQQSCTCMFNVEQHALGYMVVEHCSCFFPSLKFSLGDHGQGVGTGSPEKGWGQLKECVGTQEGVEEVRCVFRRQPFPASIRTEDTHGRRGSFDPCKFKGSPRVSSTPPNHSYSSIIRLINIGP